MKNQINFDFAKQCKPYPAFLLWSVAGCLTLVFCLVYSQYKQLKNELAKQQASSSRQIKSSTLKLSPSLQQSVKFAHQTQAALNIGWDDMLSALEKAQLESPEVKLLSVQPNPQKAQIVITGVVNDFSDLAMYIAALKKQSNFNDAVLLRQQWEDAPIGEVKLNFILSIGWQL